ncbi:MAG: hypothetical protein P0116_04120 [Candidatus Nitrosocosmicus sp.]|nr:hypothetical protein [Candidatus Nitrosocosmicus sp.]
MPREGYRNPTIVSIDNMSCINAVGLANPGTESFSKEISENNGPLIISLVDQISEFSVIANKFRS